MKKKGKIFSIILFLFVAICFTILIWDKVDKTAASKNHVFQQDPIQYPMHQSNLTLYTNGKDLYKQLFTDIKNAKQYVHISFFSIADDAISHTFEQLLQQKSEEGVDVYFAVDRLGGILLKDKEVKALKAAGVHFTYYNKPKFPYLFSSLEHRNHRRIAIIDGQIGYAGGLNIGRKYIGENKRIGHWRDYHLRIEGEGVQDLQQQFSMDWKENTNQILTEEISSTAKGSSSMQFIAYSGQKLAEDYAALFRQAQASITILSPYFIPNDETVWQALIDARARGVQIKMLWSPHSDAILVKQAAYPYIRKALQHGIQVYGYKGGVNHGKVLLIDNNILMLGTANFDSRSLHINDELNCYIYDGAFIEQVRTSIEEDFQDAEKITSSYVNDLPLQERVKEKLARLVEAWL